ncbi:MAG: nucleotidyltransferase domain-containing protein [Candidatus Gastranaerophilales bacterium]|nr:nucleotidyltransferase domain-containing protein [Candidatus Gastranaerophilales bacterium]
MPDEKLENIIQRILQVTTPDKIILFGSHARNEASAESDYDLLVIKSEIDNILKLEQKIYKNLLGLKANVDVIVRTPALLEENKNIAGSFTKNVLKDGILIYENR